MKIAVASDDKITVTGHIGRCNGFIIFNVDDNKIAAIEYRENLFTHHRMQQHAHEYSEANRHGHNQLIQGLSDCSALIFNHGGMRLIEDLKANNILPVMTDEENAETAVIKYLGGELVVNEENVCKGHGH